MKRKNGTSSDWEDPKIEWLETDSKSPPYSNRIRPRFLVFWDQAYKRGTN